MAIYFKYVCITVNAKSSHTFVGVCFYWAQWLAMVCRWQYTSSMYNKLSTRNLLTLLLECVIIGHNGWLWYVDGNILQVCMYTCSCQHEIFSHFCWSVLLLGTMVGYGM